MAKKQKKQKAPSKTQQLEAQIEQLKSQLGDANDAKERLADAFIELLGPRLEELVSDMVDEAVDNYGSSGFCCHY
jgi:predicted transcriptional regulator